MMKVIILDDEAPVLRLLRRVLESFPDVEIIGEYTNSIQGLQAIEQQQPDVCFLDVEMPNLNGFQVIHGIENLHTQFVFVTAHDRYAVEAFRVNVADYILKPITKGEVERVLNKLRPRIELPKLPQGTPALAIEFFGELQASYKGMPLEWPTEKVADLFAYFIYHTGKKVEKWELCDILWPDLPPEKARHNVYNAMYLLKRLLNTHEIDYSISNKRGFYEFTIENTSVDFKRLEQLFSSASEGEERSIEKLEQIEVLYQGDFLARKDYSWCQPIRAYYEQVYSKVIEQLLHYYVEHKLDDQAILLGRKVLQLYPEQERVAMVIMPLYLERGEPALQKFYEEYSEYCMKELNIPLSPKINAFYKQLIKKLELTC